MVRPARDVPSYGMVPSGQTFELQRFFDHVIQQLQGPVHIGTGSKKTEYRIVVNDASSLALQRWKDSAWATIFTIDANNDILGVAPVLTSPDGTKWRLTVADDGHLVTRSL